MSGVFLYSNNLWQHVYERLPQLSLIDFQIGVHVVQLGVPKHQLHGVQLHAVCQQPT